MLLRSERRYEFLADVDAVWAAMNSVDRFQEWWPWLRSFDGAAVAEGEVWHCTVRAPIPYSMTFTVTFDEVRSAALVAATIAGDVRGTAELAIEADGPRTAARLTSALRPVATLPRSVGVLVPPLARWGHRTLLDQGAAQFRAHLT